MKILLTIYLALYLSCGGSPSAPTSPAVLTRNGVDVSQRVRQITPNGAVVWSSNGVPASSLALIDQGLTRVFANAAIDHYATQVGTYGYFQIYIAAKPCQLSPEWKVPSFRVHAPNYAGTPYDVGNGDVLAAEMVLSDSEMIICPDESYMSDAVNAGAEHQLIHMSDPVYYEQSKTHCEDCPQHPLLPKNNR